jgi:large subunit ribosomal protein L9
VLNRWAVVNEKVSVDIERFLTGDSEMEVILKEDVPKLGHRGEVVKVAEGYGRNYLLPHKLAIEATTANRSVIEQMKQSAVRKTAVEKTAADALAQQLDGTALSFHRKVGEKDHLFGSVTTSDIAEALERKGFTIDRRKLQLNEPIKSLGEFEVPVRLHRDVISKVKVTVEKEAEA